MSPGGGAGHSAQEEGIFMAVTSDLVVFRVCVFLSPPAQCFKGQLQRQVFHVTLGKPLPQRQDSEAQTAQSTWGHLQAGKVSFCSPGGPDVEPRSWLAVGQVLTVPCLGSGARGCHFSELGRLGLYPRITEMSSLSPSRSACPYCHCHSLSSGPHHFRPDRGDAS